MEKFVVSARKYRPTNFDSVVGQGHITTTLKNAIANSQLAQAMLFCGPRGVGKTTCARIFARLINGFDEKDESTSFNIFELDAASNNSVDDIRNLIDQVRYPPQQGKYKVYIIDEVHMLSSAAFNAFLKTLEEPPSYAIFILATTEKQKVIPTILSRCQIFDFNRIQVSDIADHLKKIAAEENVKAEAEALHLIAQKADGALRDALSIFDLMVTFSSDQSITYQSIIENLHILDYEYYFKVVDYLYLENISDALITLDEIFSLGFDGHNFISGLSEHLRNLLVAREPKTIHLLQVSESSHEKFRKQAGSVSPSWLLSALNITAQAELNYKATKNPRLLVELSLMKIAYLNQALNPREISPDVKKKSLIASQSLN
jgi:DNA polymerase-3 subunit gamma/tau